jgi:hypothetical protein
MTSPIEQGKFLYSLKKEHALATGARGAVVSVQWSILHNRRLK